MTARIALAAAKSGRPISASRRRLGIAASVLTSAIISFSPCALADENGISFWVPGFFGSLAATPQQPGWSLANIYYHTSVSAGADVARAREFTLGRVPGNVTLNANLNLSVNSTGDLGFVVPTYVFATPVLGGQASVSLLAAYGVVGTSLAGTLSGVLTGPFGNSIPFARSDTISDTTWGFADVAPVFQMKWNAGVHNYMAYVMGGIPIGAYESTRLSNLGIGHGSIDAGGGYTYFDQQAGHEFSGVLGFTYNFKNPATQYQSGVDMHFDWGASQFLSKQVLVGLVGYVYKELGCDSGSGDRVGCFRSQVVGVGPQIGFLFPVGDMQGYVNLKAYGEFAAENRPSGWNTWVTFSVSPPAPGAPPTTKPVVRKY
ncbi:transporter [Bradyrhizobium sp. CCGB20]|uniref:SphA family protein n=1 Tax=Bradyrhizobium sp. CCGB20 TaxID=2949633 RepID=UPI002113DD44